jgi:two-component system nitrogen regulation response regulator GlnG
MKILIVDDEKLARLSIKGFLREHEIVEASTYKEAVNSLKYDKVDLAFLDLDLDKELAGLDLAKIAKEMGIYSIITTGHAEEEITDRAYRLGAQDYLQKPISEKALELALGRFINFISGPRVDKLVKSRYLTTHDKTLEELNIIKGLTRSTKPVLITGPTGTGKTIVADIIREVCNIPEKKFIAINCAQFTETLLESELFGHKKGSFTGATTDKEGLLKIADGGAVFLDEIHSLSKASQQKLMKAIEEKIFYPVGSTVPVKSDFRIICATCEDLPTLIEEKVFRSDFYARISHIKIELFPLRDRPDDILPLIHHFNSKHMRKITINEDAKKLLRSLEWKSNTRDIEALVEHWNIKGYGIITVDCIPESFIKTKDVQRSKLSKAEVKRIREMGIKNYLETYKKEIVEYFLEINDFNKAETGRALKVTDKYVGYIVSKDNSNAVRTTAEEYYENSIQ